MESRHSKKRWIKAGVATAGAALLLAQMTSFAAQAEVRSVEFAGFTAIDLSSGLAMDINVGPNFSVAIEGAPEAIDKVDIHLEGSTLVASRRHSLFSWSNDNRQVTLSVTMPKLEAVAADAGAHIGVSGAIEQSVQAVASAGANIVVTGIDGAAVSLEASGGASIEARGTCSEIVVRASGGASVDAGLLACAVSTAEASSGASVRVKASESQDLRASSGASLTAKGGGRIVWQDASSGANISVRP